MTTLASLSSFAPELSADQTATVDGGLLPLILGLAFVDGVLWGYIVGDAIGG
jgi:hypothetical protein